MIKTIDVSDLKPEQIENLQDIIAAFKVQNQANKNGPSKFNMIDYLLEHPLEVDDLQFMKREEIYDRNK